MKLTRIIFLVLTAFICSCKENESSTPFSGTWISTFKVENMNIKLDIESQSEGVFILVNPTAKTLKELGKSKFKLKNMNSSDNKLTFLVQILPEQNEESLVFSLELKNGELEGILKENNSKAKETKIKFKREI